MPKQSAGLLVYHHDENNTLKVLLVHPGGPFYTKKDNGVWSIPKGEYNEGENALDVAKREFEEETGNKIEVSEYLPLGNITLRSGKVITAWAVQQYFETPFLQSNVFEMEWPPKSGKKATFPETDNAAYFTPAEAKIKMYESQHPFIDRLLQLLMS